MTDDPDTPRTTAAPVTAANTGAASDPVATEPASAPAPLAAPVPVSLTPAPPPRSGGTDIAKILKDVKLPERPQQKTPPPPLGQSPALGVLPTFEVHTPAPAGEKPVVAPPASTASGPTSSEHVGVQYDGATSPAEAKDEASAGIASLHTMKGDLQGVVRDRKISLVRAAAMEQDRVTRPPLRPTMSGAGGGSGRKIGLMLTAALLLLALAGAALYFAYTLVGGSTAAHQPITTTSLLFAENQAAISIDGQSGGGLKQVLGGMLAQPGPVGSITQVIPTISASDAQAGQRPATLKEFLDTLGVHPPADLVRALSSDFFLGIHMADVPSPVFIIPVLSYDRAFAGMLAWEPSIDADLAPLFRQVPNITAPQNGGLPGVRQFKDLVVRNYDVRGLSDDSGAVVLYYSFPTPDLLIIAASPYTFPEVLSRLQAERKL